RTDHIPYQILFVGRHTGIQYIPPVGFIQTIYAVHTAFHQSDQAWNQFIEPDYRNLAYFIQIEIWIIEVRYLSIQLAKRQIRPHLKTYCSGDQSLIMRLLNGGGVVFSVRDNLTQVSICVNDYIVMRTRVRKAIAWLFFKSVKVP